MKKRGQVTTFIIVGIIILAIIGVVLAIRSGVLDVYLDSERNKVIVAEDIVPVQQDLESCLLDNLAFGLDQLGSQGGYLKLENQDNFGFSNNLEIFGNIRTAYWYYEDLNGNGVSKIPTKKEMEEQLNEFIEIGFRECLIDLERFENSGYDISYNDNIKSDVKIEDNLVDLVVRSPVSVSFSGVNADIPRHVVRYETNIGGLYEKAKEFFEENNEKLWLENKTKGYLDIYKDELPSYNTEFTCETFIWNKGDIERNYKNILELNIPYYYVEGSEIDSYYEDEEIYGLDVNGDYAGNNIYFEYDKNWPFEFDVEPNQGGVLVSQPFPGGIPQIGFCSNTYNFIYSVKHPVLITFEEDDDEFSFAHQVVIRNNKIREPIDIEELDYVQFCDSRDSSVYLEVTSNEGFLEPLENASVYYKCLNNICYVGETDDLGVYDGNIPACIGGFLEVRKEGYETVEERFDSFESGSLFLPIDKEKELNYEFKVYDLVNDNLVGPRSLNNDESVLFQIDDVITGDSKIGFYPEGDEIISITPGSYLLTTKLINNGGAHISSKEISQCNCPEIFGVCGCGSTNVVLDPLDLETVVTGGGAVNWNLGNEVYDSEKVIIYLINKGKPSTYDEIQNTYNAQFVSLGFENRIIPMLE